MSKKIEIYTARGPEGAALVVNGTRVSGPKPWGGGAILHEFEVDKKELHEALRRPPSKARLWRRLRGQIGLALFAKSPAWACAPIEDVDSVHVAVTKLTRTLRARGMPKCAAKLEAALKAWEAAP